MFLTLFKIYNLIIKIKILNKLIFLINKLKKMIK